MEGTRNRQLLLRRARDTDSENIRSIAVSLMEILEFLRSAAMERQEANST